MSDLYNKLYYNIQNILDGGKNLHTFTYVSKILRKDHNQTFMVISAQSENWYGVKNMRLINIEYWIVYWI